MATNLNSITVVGNLTRDPELRYFSNGGAVVNFGVAVNRSWMNRQTNEWQEQTSFFDVTCRNEMAENAAQTLSKGMRVLVSGRLDMRSWETQDGDKRSKIEIVAEEVGPSLRFATAQVTRTERREGQGGGDQGGYAPRPEQGYGTSNGRPQGGGSTNGGPARQPEPANAGQYDYADEEPF